MARGPIIILGAARSGTKMLRRAVAQHPRVDEIPHDINFIWKWGNWAQASDELVPEQVDPGHRQEIVTFFERFRQRGNVVVEKTVANTVRVAFVREVFPKAVFVHLIRDGHAVAESVRRQFHARPDVVRLLTKLRYFPWQALTTYAASYVRDILPGVLDGRGRVRRWGVNYDGLDTALQSSELIVAAALQWEHCVRCALRELGQLDRANLIELRYEELGAGGENALNRLWEICDLPHSSRPSEYLAASFDATAIDHWKEALDSREIEAIEESVGTTLSALGYEGRTTPTAAAEFEQPNGDD